MWRSQRVRGWAGGRRDVLAGRGLQAEISGAGRIAIQVSRALGGHTQVIANELVLKKLDEMSHGLAEFAITDGGPDKPKGRVRGPFVPVKQWFQLLLRVNKNDEGLSQRQMQVLTEQGVLRIGMRLKCPRCTQTTWFALPDLDDEVRCERCLGQFPFPAAKLPPRDEAWCYRTQGAFSIENYAQGAYAVLLALRFLTEGIRAEATSAPSLGVSPLTRGAAPSSC